MKRNKYLLLYSSLGSLCVLMWAAFEEYHQTWRSLQEEYRARLPIEKASSFSIQLRQLVVPSLDATDRCISCHVGMAPGEQGIAGHSVFGRHPNVVHDPAEVGCTICHGGQGRATTVADAHGQVPFWPEPMIPREFAYSGCGTCHTHLAVPSGEELERGRLAFEQNDCFACHRIDGQGGTLRPGGAGGLEGPDLSRAGAAGYDEEWYAKHAQRSGNTANSVWTTAFGRVSDVDRQAIEAYLKTRVGAPGLVEGKTLFHSLGCRGCHNIGGVGGDTGPELTHVGQKDPGQMSFVGVQGDHTLKNWFVQHFRSPAAVVVGSTMPQFGLSAPQIQQLTAYMFSLRRSNVPERSWPKDRILAERFGKREFSTDGATIYGTFCAACHGQKGEGMRYGAQPVYPAIGNQDFLSVASDEFLFATVRKGRPGRRMPAWANSEGGLQEPEIAAVVAYLRQLGGASFLNDGKPKRWVQRDASEGQRLYSDTCARCHGVEGEGGEGPALHNGVLLQNATDSYLLETIRRGRRGTSMEGFGQGSTVRKTLTTEDIESVVAFLRTWETSP